MKLIAKVTIVQKDGEVSPGDHFEIRDEKEARALIARGFASEPQKAASADGDSEDGTK